MAIRPPSVNPDFLPGESLQSSQPTPLADETPWLVAVSRALIADAVGPRLGVDAFILAFVVADQQDQHLRNEIDCSWRQLAKACGFSTQHRGRFREARQRLIDDGWLWCDTARHDERATGMYRLTPPARCGISEPH